MLNSHLVIRIFLHLLLCSQSALTGLWERFGRFQTKNKSAHDHQRTFTIMITTAATARNIRLLVGTIITSNTGIAYGVEHSGQSTPPQGPHHGFSLLISVRCTQGRIK